MTLLFFRESVAQLMDAGKKVVDSPVHLADFGESDNIAYSFSSSLAILSSEITSMCCWSSLRCALSSSTMFTGAALTSAESWQLQAVLESTVVSLYFWL